MTIAPRWRNPNLLLPSSTFLWASVDLGRPAPVYGRPRGVDRDTTPPSASTSSAQYEFIELAAIGVADALEGARAFEAADARSQHSLLTIDRLIPLHQLSY